MRISSRVRTLLRKTGYDIRRFDHISSPVARSRMLLGRYGIDLVFDVGANDGGYASALREEGFDGRIVSFEPLSSAYATLARRSRNDPSWAAINVALGREKGSRVIHVASSTESSSFLEMLPRHKSAAPDITYTSTEMVDVRRFSEMFGQYYSAGDKALLKVDTQGSEIDVLEGARAVISEITGLQLELSLVPLYDGAPIIEDMLRFVRDLGFAPMSLEPAFGDSSTGQLLQIDALFFRE